MSPLAGERFASDDVRRTSDHTQRDYREFMRRWSPELNRELTDAELAQRQHAANLGTAHHPPSEFEMQMESRRENQRIEAAQREREQRERAAKAHRDRVAAFEANEVLILNTMNAYGLTPEERSELTIQLGPRATDLSAVTWACERILDLKQQRREKQ